MTKQYGHEADADAGPIGLSYAHVNKDITNTQLVQCVVMHVGLYTSCPKILPTSCRR